MIQMPNIIKNPRIWIPPIISSIVLAPLSTVVFKMTNSSVGSGMGTSGLVGQFSAYADMASDGKEPLWIILQILIMHFILPGLLTFGIAEGMRKAKWIKNGDMKLNL